MESQTGVIEFFKTLIILFFRLQVTHMSLWEGLNQQRILTLITFTFMSPAWPVQKSNVLGKLIAHFHELNELELTIELFWKQYIFFFFVEKHNFGKS